MPKMAPTGRTLAWIVRSARRVPVAPFVALALVLSFANTPRAHAQPTSADLETARALFKEGRDLRAQGRLAEAIEKLKAAHTLGQTPITGLELARTYAGVRRLIDARETALGVARIAVAPDETERSAEARKEAAALAEELRPRIPSITIRIEGHARDTDRPESAALVVTVDGERIPPSVLGEPRKVDPGLHVIAVRGEDPSSNTAQEVVRVEEREERVVTVVYSTLNSPASAPAAASPDGFLFGASFIVAPHLYFPITGDGRANKTIVEVMAGGGFEIGAALTPSFEIMGRAFATLGDRGKPSYAIGAGPAMSYRVVDRLWIGAGLFGGRADTRFEGIAYSTDWVIGATLDASLVALRSNAGEWLLTATPGYFFSNPRADNADFFINVAFGYRSY